MKIIFICTGNTCRSPMAEGYLKAAALPDLEVQSRGLYADGSPVSENSALVMNELGIDISGHISRSLCREDLDSDLFICLSDSHRLALLSLGIDENKVLLLGDGIPDPFGGNLTVYRVCRDKIISAIDKLIYSGTFTPFSLCTPDSSLLADIAELEKECFSEPWSQNALFESMKAGTKFFTVCDKEERLLGYVGISTILDEGYITNVAVTRTARRKGVATLLMHKLFSLARELSLSFISLEVRASNSSAISLYEKFGFVREGLRKKYYREPVEDTIIMTKRFENHENFEY